MYYPKGIAPHQNCNVRGIEERQNSNKDSPSSPAIAINVKLESQTVNDAHEKKATQDGHDVITYTNGEVEVCNLENNVRDNVHTEGNESSGSGQIEVQQQVFVVEHYAWKSQDAMAVSAAGVSDPGNSAPKMLDDNEQDPVPRAVEGCDEATIMSDQSQGSQQDKDTMQSQT